MSIQYLKTVVVGDNKYHLNHNGADIYYSRGSKTRGENYLRAVKFRNNEIIDITTGKAVTEYQLGQYILSY